MDIALCEAAFRYTHNEPTTVRARIHAGEEAYRRAEVDREIETLQALAGTRTYLHLRPYIFEPEVLLTVGLAPKPSGNRIGAVLGSSWEGMRHREVGQVQAWHYPADRLTVLWECFFDRPFRDRPLREDPNMAALWTGMEAFLLARFPRTERLVTPSRDPEFEDEEYREFLRRRGYERATAAAFMKGAGRT